MGLSRLTSSFRNLNKIRTNSTGNWFLQDSFPLFRRKIPHNKASISTSTTKFQCDAEVLFMNVLSNSSHEVSVEMAEKFWFEQFSLKNIPEASISIQHILAHTIGFQNVSFYYLKVKTGFFGITHLGVYRTLVNIEPFKKNKNKIGLF